MRFHALLAANASTDAHELAERLDEYAHLGFDGVVWRASGELARAGLCERDFATLSEAILHARELGLSFWIEDVAGWPGDGRTRPVGGLRASGDGLVGSGADAPSSHGRVRWLELEGEVREGDRIRGGSVRVCERPGVSAFSTGAAAAFIDRTLERYRRMLDERAFAHVDVFLLGPADFSDGPARPTLRALPWPSDLEEALVSQGFATDPASLRGLFLGDSEEAREQRVAYWEALEDCAARAFWEPVRAWCEGAGKRFCAWAVGSGNPWTQVGRVGSSLDALARQSAPGACVPGRELKGHLRLRLASSVAAQTGVGLSICEAFGGSGNGATPEDLERHLRFIGDCGISDMVVRADHLRPTASAIRDWPVSLPVHVTWGPVVAAVLDRCREADASPAARKGSRAVVVVPTRALQARYAPGQLPGGFALTQWDPDDLPDTAAVRISEAVCSLVDESVGLGVCPELVEERSLERTGVVRQGGLSVGKAVYQRVIAFPEAYESPQVSRLLASLAAAGGEVLTPRGWLASLGKVTTSFDGMPETLAVGRREASESRDEGGSRTECGASFQPQQAPWRVTGPAQNLLKLELGAPEDDEDARDDDGVSEGAGAAISPRTGEGSGEDSEDARATILSRAGEDGGADVPEGALLARTTFIDDLTDAGLSIMLSDSVAQLAWDGIPLEVRLGEHGLLFASLPELSCGVGTHVLTLVPADEGRPAVFLAGRFGVWARLWPFDERQMTTLGDFELYREGRLSELSYDLLESGYAFSFQPITLTKSFVVDASGSYRLSLMEVHAPAARIRIDHGDPLDVWGPDFRTGPVHLAAGSHALEVEVYNSTYNVLGPHHYYRGDASLVTPAQFEGVRNFADPIHAPEHTATDAWHFLRWGVGEDIELVRAGASSAQQVG